MADTVSTLSSAICLVKGAQCRKCDARKKHLTKRIKQNLLFLLALWKPLSLKNKASSWCKTKG